MRRIRIVIAVLLFITVFVANIHAQESSLATQTTPTAAPEVKHEGHDRAPEKDKRFTATVSPDGVQRVEIVGGEYYFEPNYIVLKANVPVELTLKKGPGFVPHDIVVKAADAGINFHEEFKKEPKIVRFTPTLAGKYEMTCDKKLLFFKSHKERGMHGTIEVVQ
jgi:plastocyanin